MYTVTTDTEYYNAVSGANPKAPDGTAIADGDIVRLANDIELGSGVYYYVEKAITIDLNGYTLTTTRGYGTTWLKNSGCSIISSKVDETTGEIVRGTIRHTGGISIIKVWWADKIENVNLISDRVAGKTAGGISFQEGNTIHANLIKNVTISGNTLTYGIETYNSGLSECVIGKMENVVVDATTYGITLNAPCGVAENCVFEGDIAGIFIWTKGGYSAELELVDCEVSGGTTAVAVSINEAKNGSIDFAADEATTLESTSGTIFTTTQYVAYENVTVNATVPGFEVSEDGKVVCSGEHNYSSVVTEPTCEAAGYTTYTCSVCSDTYVADEVAATGHNYAESARVESTCTTAGSVTYTCSACGDSYKEALELAAHTEVEIPAVLPLPSNGHKGSTAGVKCLECGEVIVEPVEVTVTMTSDYEIFGIQEMTLSLANNIAINYKTNIPSSYKNVYMVFVYEDSEYIVNEYSVSGAYYSFKFDETRPHKMASNVAAYIYGETEEGYTLDYILEYSIMKYCVNQLSRNPSAELKTVISDVLTYGAAVQRYVYGDKISEAELVTSMVEAKGYTLTPTAFPGIESGNQIKYDDVEPMTYYWTQVSLMLGSTTEMYFRFKAPSIDDGLKIKVEYSDQVIIYEADDIVSEGNGVYRISVDCLTSMQYVYDVKATFVVDDVELSSMTDSINSYLYRQVDKQSGYTQEVMKALYVYGQSVRGYFGK
ncbi:MAG: hypothetical protein J6A53_01820 [Clostridia bacterium]|nr:hypothetical protein [Clostridia bacterium]